MTPDPIASTPPAAAASAAASGIFHEPSANGELAPPPAAALPGVPAMPEHFEAPGPDDHLRPDAARGASQLD
ncbi:MAG: hypothetical protein H7287_00380 [Thermoleophilia bacterium]|nr:hypothetical protein [Thermoleophilia bacterium]